jgi:hypothetical protein
MIIKNSNAPIYRGYSNTKVSLLETISSKMVDLPGIGVHRNEKMSLSKTISLKILDLISFALTSTI